MREGVPVRFVDSLFGFWIVGRDFANLGRVAEAIRLGSEEEASAAFASLSVHESMVVAHMLATESCAQAFPGVAERVELLATQGFRATTVTGAVIDLGGISPVARQAPRTLVSDLGGFTNAFPEYEEHGAYVDVMLRWLERIAAGGSDFDEIIVCSGTFRRSREYAVNGVRFRVGLLPHADLLELLSTGPVYLAPPGLTSLHEAALEIPVMLLPDQHYGHAQRPLVRPAAAGAADPLRGTHRPAAAARRGPPAAIPPVAQRTHQQRGAGLLPALLRALHRLTGPSAHRTASVSSKSASARA